MKTFIFLIWALAAIAWYIAGNAEAGTMCIIYAHYLSNQK